MSTATQVQSSDSVEPAAHGRAWLPFLLAGAIMVALGTFVIGWACLTSMTVVAVWLFGSFLIVGGIAEILTALWAGKWSGRLVHLLIGAMYLVIGFIFMTEPKDSAVRLTLIIAIFLIVSGVIRIVASLAENLPGRGSMLLNGVVTLVLGVLIYRQWPESALWVIGLFIGIEMLFNGWTWVFLSLAARKRSKA
jgi:uncharacterized membrane protein HdeD (DUF308 family)